MATSSQFIPIFIFSKSLPRTQSMRPMSAFCCPYFSNRPPGKSHNSLSVLLITSLAMHRVYLGRITAPNYF
ncbi:hypothetical protein PSAR109036_06080 [Psychrobacter arenosus]